MQCVDVILGLESLARFLPSGGPVLWVLANNAARQWHWPEAWGYFDLVKGMESELIPKSWL